MVWRLPVGLALTAAILGGCSVVQPNLDCRINERCDAVLAAARSVVPLDGARVVVLWGRGPAASTPRFTSATRMDATPWLT